MDRDLKRIIDGWHAAIGDSGNRYTVADIMGISRRTWDRWTRATEARSLPPGISLSAVRIMREVAESLIVEANRLESGSTEAATAPRPPPPADPTAAAAPPRLVG
jgi:hypothetical protein